MADTEALKDRMLREAEKQAQKIQEQADKRVEEILKKAEEEGADRKKELIEDAHEEAEDKKEREITLANLKRRNSILEAKQKEIASIFKTVLESSQDLDRGKYKKILQKMILNEVQYGDEELILSKEDREDLGKDFLDEINSQLEKEDMKGSLTYAERSAQISGGFILARDGIENNNSFEVLLSMQREELEAGVADILFGTEE